MQSRFSHRLPRFIRTLLCLSFFVSSNAWAAVDVWQSASSTDWNTNGNWSGGTPNSGTSATISDPGLVSIILTSNGTTGSFSFAAPQSYSVSTGASTLTIAGSGVTNTSGLSQQLIANNGGTLALTNSASINAVNIALNTNVGGTFDVSGITGGSGISTGALTNNGTTTLGTNAIRVTNYSGSGTLNTTISGASTYGVLNVTGNANLSNTTLGVSLGNSFVPLKSQNFTVVQAGSITGQFASITQPSSSITMAASYTGTTALITLANLPYETDVNTNNLDVNELHTAAALDAIRNSATGDLVTVVGVLNTLNASQLASALDQIDAGGISMMSQMVYASQNAEFASLVQRFNAINNGTTNLASNGFDYYADKDNSPMRLAEAGAPDSSLLRGSSADQPVGIFASGSGSYGSVGTTSGPQGTVAGYSFNTYGSTFGGDYRLNDWLTLGLAGGYISTHSSSVLNDDNVYNQSFRYGVYGVAHRNGWMGTGYIGGAHDLYQETRNLSFGTINRTATGAPEGSEFSTRWSLSYDYNTKWATLEPTANIEYDRVFVDSFQESGAGSLDMNYDSQIAESLRSEIGGRITRQFTTAGLAWTPYVSLSWMHEYENQNQAVNAQLASGGGDFSTVTPQVGPDAALVGVGGIFQIDKTVSLYANYLGEEARTNFSANNFDGGVRLRF